MKRTALLSAGLVVALLATGCSNKKLLGEQAQQITDLQSEVQSLSGDLDSERARNEQIKSKLEAALSDLKTKQRVWTEEKKGLVQITLDGEVSFASGSARISDAGREVLDRIWGVLTNYPDRDVLIEGHTDNVPIAPQYRDHYKSNWELSSARANSVLHYVIKKYGVDPSRIAAVGYGEHRPVASNDTEEGRAMNRRVVITVGPRSKMPKAMP